MVRKGRLILTVALLFLVQATVVHRFSYDLLRPNLLYALAAFLALEGSWRAALGGAFALGMLMDLGSAGRLGASALAMVLAAAGLFALRERLVRERAWTDIVLVFLFTLVCGLARGGAVWLCASGGSAGALGARALGQAAFTAALSPLLFAAFAEIGIVPRASLAFDAT